MGGASASLAAVLDAVSRSPRRPRGSRALHPRPALAASNSNRAIALSSGAGQSLESSSAQWHETLTHAVLQYDVRGACR
jgi:hypothetical protein